MNTTQEKQLLEAAQQARKNALIPYTHYPVGAALLTRSGKIYTGCNVETCTMIPSIHAEQLAIFTAIANADRDFIMLAIATRDGGAPCGICRQLLREFVTELPILTIDDTGKVNRYEFATLFPHSFGPANVHPGQAK